jgi:uncharacterized delta-60 repeat protein
MSLLPWFRRLFAPSTKPSLPRRAPRAPRLEALEDRTLLSASSMDPTFGIGGKVLTPFPPVSLGGSISAEARQADGKLVVAGSAFSGNVDLLLVARYNSNGTLDTTFGQGGITRMSIGQGFPQVAGVALLPGGKIVLAGNFSAFSGTSTEPVVLAEFNANGTPNTAFGQGGLVVSDLGPNTAAAVLVDSTGGIVVGGTSFASISANSTFLLARYKAATGALDTSFGSGGKVVTAFSAGAVTLDGVALAPGGKLVAAGHSPTGDFAVAEYSTSGALVTGFGSQGKTIVAVMVNPAQDNCVAVDGSGQVLLVGTTAGASPGLSVARLTSAGAVDNTFGNQGTASAAVDGTETSAGIALDGKGHIVTGGSAFSNNSTNIVAVRFSATDGTQDTSYGNGGVASVTFSGTTAFPRVVTADSTGRAVLAGFSIPNAGTSSGGFALVRLDATGKPDSTFGSGGKVFTDIKGSSAAGHAVVVQTDGKIVVAGDTVVNGSLVFALARYTVNGKLDSTFGKNGLVTTAFPATNDVANAIVLDGKGHILVAGSAGFSGGFMSTNTMDFAVARYNASNGALDTTFGKKGLVTIDFSSPTASSDDSATGIAVDSSGRIVVAGQTSSFNNTTETRATNIAVARLKPTGALDTTFGKGGKVVTSFSDKGDSGQAVALDASGRILVAADTGVDTAISGGIEVVRFTSKGAVDTTFGKGGHTIAALGNFGSAAGLTVDSSGHILVAGTTGTATHHIFALLRYTATGALDSTFGKSGKVILDLGHDALASGLALDHTGHILVSGTAFTGTLSDFSLARFSATNGAVDKTFSKTGFVITDLGAADDDPAGLVVQANGKIVVAGRSNGDFAVVRYQG